MSRAPVKLVFGVAVVVASFTARLEAQCPDGTPPPGAAARAARLPAPPANSVAVLYFDNLSRDSADVFLADGLTDELITRLSQVRRLGVRLELPVLPRMENVLGPEDLRTFDGVVRLERGDATAAERLSWSYYGGVLAAEFVRAELALGRRDVARAAVDSMIAWSGRGYYNAFSVARAHAVLGDTDAAFAWLDRAWAQRTNWLVFVRRYAEFAPLHSDPRWATFLSRMGVRP